MGKCIHLWKFITEWTLLFFFSLKTDSSHTIYLDHNFPCLCYYPPPLFPSSILPLFPFKKQQTSKRQQPKTTKQNTVKQCKIPHTEARQGSPRGGKESQEQAKEPETHGFPQLGAPHKCQTNSHNICRPLQALYLLLHSLSPSVACLVDSLSHVLRSPSSVGFPKLWGKGPNRGTHSSLDSLST